MPFGESYLFHSELGAGAEQHEKRKHLEQVTKKIGRGPKRRSLPFGESYLFHSELGAGARQPEKRKHLGTFMNELGTVPKYGALK
ncbi:hypothetical protein [Peribacillus asahii]|uniref:hypothetical protein n=1 Tax=Peribacillus asahii TaxID=228899 RepID=UPI0038119A08